MKNVVFVDRDGTILQEPADECVDSLEKMVWVPGAISALRDIRKLDYELVIASNQDGLGTPVYPMEAFNLVEGKMLQTLEGEGVVFDDILIDRTTEDQHQDTRKPGTGMFGRYLSGDYDLSASFMIGDRDTDGQLARNLGATFLRIDPARPAASWAEALKTISSAGRTVDVKRNTAETKISVRLGLDCPAGGNISSGLGFFDHMLTQLIHHGNVYLDIKCDGDLNVDEHHSMEDIGIALGEAVCQALGKKVGIQRYGFALPMDESRAVALLDFGGRAELVWDVNFTVERIGDTPTEMFKHFFNSFCNAAGCNLYVQARGENNHHIAESVFKAFARALRMAVERKPFDYSLPSSKGVL